MSRTHTPVRSRQRLFRVVAALTVVAAPIVVAAPAFAAPEAGVPLVVEQQPAAAPGDAAAQDIHGRGGWGHRGWGGHGGWGHRGWGGHGGWGHGGWGHGGWYGGGYNPGWYGRGPSTGSAF
ncbi:hypothetical protein [Nocardia sp. N2S4-5]|uniref:hypothetical protein n=1 Tax=Nocardia sp. N2S4-5 TaxID=3351565 RepID=UPI0037CFE7F3